MATTFIDAGGVAQLLEISRGQFLSRRNLLEADAEFPLPMPHSSRPLLWRRTQVERWIERQGTPKETQPIIPQGSNIHLLAEARRA